VVLLARVVARERHAALVEIGDQPVRVRAERQSEAGPGALATERVPHTDIGQGDIRIEQRREQPAETERLTVAGKHDDVVARLESQLVASLGGAEALKVDPVDPHPPPTTLPSARWWSPPLRRSRCDP